MRRPRTDPGRPSMPGGRRRAKITLLLHMPDGGAHPHNGQEHPQQKGRQHHPRPAVTSFGRKAGRFIHECKICRGPKYRRLEDARQVGFASLSFPPLAERARSVKASAACERVPRPRLWRRGFGQSRREAVGLHQFDQFVHCLAPVKDWHCLIAANEWPVWKEILPVGCLARLPAIDAWA